MIIWRNWPFAYYHLEDLAFYKWSSGGSGLLQIIIWHPHHPNHLSQDLNSISRTFLEQFALVSIISFNCRLDLSIKQSFCFLSILKMAGTLIKMEYPVTVWYIVWVAGVCQISRRGVRWSLGGELSTKLNKSERYKLCERASVDVLAPIFVQSL